MRFMDRLKNKTAVITGAGSGIGRTAAEIFAAEGAQVLVLELDQAAAEEAVSGIQRSGGRAEAFPVDISDESAVRRVFEQIGKRYCTEYR